MCQSEHPSCSVSITDQTSGGISTWKSERLQERERAAEYVTTCERENGVLRLDRKLSEQKGCRYKIGNAHDGLQNRDGSCMFANGAIAAAATVKRMMMPTAIVRCRAVAGMVAITNGKSCSSF